MKNSERRHHLECEIEKFAAKRADSRRSVGVYQIAAEHLFYLKGVYNHFWVSNPDIPRPADLIEDRGAFYLERWADMPGFGGLRFDTEGN